MEGVCALCDLTETRFPKTQSFYLAQQGRFLISGEDNKDTQVTGCSGEMNAADFFFFFLHVSNIVRTVVHIYHFLFFLVSFTHLVSSCSSGGIEADGGRHVPQHVPEFSGVV